MTVGRGGLLGGRSNRVVVTVVGEDRVGIIAAVATVLADAGGNILDIDQGIVQEFFVMTMMVDLATASVPFDEIYDFGLGPAQPSRVTVGG